MPRSEIVRFLAAQERQKVSLEIGSIMYNEDPIVFPLRMRPQRPEQTTRGSE